jgi:hypothetical protein
VWYEQLQKGGRADVSAQYRIPSLPFLYGPRHRETTAGIRIVAEPVRDVFVEAIARTFTVGDEANATISHGHKPEFVVAIRYGLR